MVDPEISLVPRYPSALGLHMIVVFRAFDIYPVSCVEKINDIGN